MGLALSTSGLQQTYGIAGHSLILLSSYLFSIGLYLSGIALSETGLSISVDYHYMFLVLLPLEADEKIEVLNITLVLLLIMS